MRPSYPDAMLPFEWLAGAWFAAILVATPLAAAPPSRRVIVLGSCGALLLLIGVMTPRSSLAVRYWLPHLYLVAGYWLPALLVPVPSEPTRFEQWLCRTDAALRPRLPPVPRSFGPLVELAYLFCYPLVPVSFCLVWLGGDLGAANRFWVAVLSAGYACYGSLPWLVSRPPRLIVADMLTPRPFADANRFVLAQVSHQLNTFPSGHVAVSCAAAGSLLVVAPRPGAIVAVIAAAIAVGAAAGRYHFVIDVALGVIAGGLGLLIASAVR